MVIDEDVVVEPVEEVEGALATLGDLEVGPGAGRLRIDPDHDMHVVGHDGVAIQRDGEVRSQLQQAILDPGLAVFERLAGVAIEAAEERATNAAADAVVEAGRVGRDEVGAGGGHESMLARPDQQVCQRIARRAVGERRYCGC